MEKVFKVINKRFSNTRCSSFFDQFAEKGQRHKVAKEQRDKRRERERDEDILDVVPSLQVGREGKKREQLHLFFVPLSLCAFVTLPLCAFNK